MEERILHNIKKFSQRIRRDRFAKVYAPLADCYRRVGLNDDALEICRVGLEIFPRYLACHEVLGKIHLRHGRLADAKRELELVHSVITDSVELNQALIKLYSRLGEFEKAAPLLDEVIEKNPFDFEMRNIRTQMHRQTEVQKLGESAGVDIYDLAERKSAVLDIRTIIAEDDTYRAIDREAATRATDHTLNNLEQLESSIDEVAALLSEEAGEVHGGRPRPPLNEDDKRALLRRQETLAEGIEELNIAAVMAQVELEISLLDEATIVCRRMLAGEPQDEDLQSLAAKLNRRLEEKEGELDKLENMNLARGL
jgi:tetratricopeptide (TPR) repeat protein